MKDLESQIAAYAQMMDSAAPSVEELAPAAERAAGKEFGAPIVEIDSRRRPPSWLAAAAAAAAVVVAFGSVAVINALRGEEEVAVSTSTVPTTLSDSTPTISVAPNPVRQTPVTLVSPEPVIGAESYTGAELFSSFSLGDVALVDGTFHALLGAKEAVKGLYHASSADGSVWVVDSDVVEIVGVEKVGDVRATTLMQVEDGSWLAYMEVSRDLGGFGDHIYKYWIHRATAPDVTGPWTVSDVPVLSAGEEGAWDDNWVRDASVIRGEGGWTMFYLGDSLEETKTGMSSTIHGLHALGIATSDDGIVWEKRPTPVFLGDPDSSFEEGGISRVQVKSIDGEFLLTYAGRTGGNRGIAISDDGLSWTRDSRNPVMTTIEVPRGSIFDTALVNDDGVLRWYAVAGGRVGTAMYELLLEK